MKIIELNPRFWGSVLASLHAGVNFPHLACLVGLGRPVPRPEFKECRYVAGATAVHYWVRGRIRRKRAGFTFRDTVFPYVLADPFASILEWLAR